LLSKYKPENSHLLDSSLAFITTTETACLFYSPCKGIGPALVISFRLNSFFLSSAILSSSFAYLMRLSICSITIGSASRKVVRPFNILSTLSAKSFFTFTCSSSSFYSFVISSYSCLKLKLGGLVISSSAFDLVYTFNSFSNLSVASFETLTQAASNFSASIYICCLTR
jgi:hypothetical protein